MKYLLYAITVISFFACRNQVEESNASFNNLNQDQKENKDLNKKGDYSGMINHIVLFKLKSKKDAPTLLSEIDKLEAIPAIKSINYGQFKSLNDYRALSEYDIIMELILKDSIAYLEYQNHPIHLNLKNQVKYLLAAPPATYDYFIQ